MGFADAAEGPPISLMHKDINLQIQIHLLQYKYASSYYKYTSAAESQLTNIPASEPRFALRSIQGFLEEFLSMLDKELFALRIICYQISFAWELFALRRI